MRIPMEYLNNYLHIKADRQINEPRYYLKEGLSEEIIKKLKDFNAIYKKSVGLDIISFP